MRKLQKRKKIKYKILVNIFNTFDEILKDFTEILKREFCKILDYDNRKINIASVLSKLKLSNIREIEKIFKKFQHYYQSLDIEGSKFWLLDIFINYYHFGTKYIIQNILTI